jgi:hypothetical protein
MSCASAEKSLYDVFDFGRTTGPLLAGVAGARSDIPPKSAPSQNWRFSPTMALEQLLKRAEK